MRTAQLSPSLALMIVACAASTPPPTVEVAPAPTSAPAAPPPSPPPPPPAAPTVPPHAQPPAPWSSWREVGDLRGASLIFDANGLCASGPERTRCLDGRDLGPAAGHVLASRFVVWGFSYLCGVDSKGALVCDKPFAELPPKGPPRLANLMNATVHAAAHRDGMLSVTSNTSPTGYADPKWKKVAAVHDAVEAASSWYSTTSCYRRKNGGVACVANDPKATPKPVAGVTDAARIAKTDAALWVLTSGGDLLATKNVGGPMTLVAHDIVDFVPYANAPGVAPRDPSKGSANPEIPCAVTRTGALLCGMNRSWELSPVPTAGPTRRVFGDYDWICAVDDAGAVHCAGGGD